MVVRYRTYTGLKPVIDVYNADNALKVNDGAMAEIGTTGIYEYELKFLTSWGKGDFTLVCSETTKGTMDALTITVLKTDIEDISGQVSAVLGTTTSISGLKSVADSLNSQFSIIETALTKVGKDLVKEVKEAVSSATALESVYTQLSNVAKEIKAMGGDSGINLEKLYEVSSEKKDDLNYLKNKTQEMKAVIELNQKMVDNIANKPITQTWYEYK
jgi:methyl-accepting chemotaxis protein